MPGITNPSEKYFKDGQWTFDGTVWRPQNQLLSYRDTVDIAVVIADAAAGNNTLYTTAVPTGEVHVMTFATAWNDTSNCTMARFRKDVSGSAYWIDVLLAPARWFPLKFQGTLVMKAGDRLAATFYGCTVHDILYMTGAGYKFKIAE
jgi:hypothetical protein